MAPTCAQRRAACAVGLPAWIREPSKSHRRPRYVCGGRMARVPRRSGAVCDCLHGGSGELMFAPQIGVIVPQRRAQCFVTPDAPRLSPL